MRFIILATFLCLLWPIQYAYGSDKDSQDSNFEPPLGIPGHWKEENISEPNSETSRLKILVDNQQKKIVLLESKVALLEAELQKQKQKNKTK